MGTVSTPTSSIHPAHTGEEDSNRVEPEPQIRTPTTNQLNQQADLGFDWPELVTDGQNLPDQNPCRSLSAEFIQARVPYQQMKPTRSPDGSALEPEAEQAAGCRSGWELRF
jgi:hypothetical protein